MSLAGTPWKSICNQAMKQFLLRSFLLEHGALRVMVSGSGPTLLALFRDDAAAQAAYARATSEFDPAIRFLLPS